MRLAKAVMDELGLAVGARLEIVSATPGRLTLVRDESRLRAIERMRARNLPIPVDYIFDRDECNAR